MISVHNNTGKNFFLSSVSFHSVPTFNFYVITVNAYNFDTIFVKNIFFLFQVGLLLAVVSKPYRTVTHFFPSNDVQQFQ